MGMATSNLPQIAVLGVEVFIYPLVAAMWFNSRTLSGWAIAGVYTYFWFLIRVGFNIRDPLLSYPVLSDDFADASRIYFAWYPLFIALALLVAWLICLLMDIREPVPFYAIFPSFSTHNIENVVSTPCYPIDLARLRDYYCACEKGLQRWCFSFIDPPYWHTFVGILLALFTLTLPAFLFWILLPTNKWAAYLSALGVRILGYIFAWLYWTYRTDLYVWGPSEYNMKARLEASALAPDTSVYAFDPDIRPFAGALYAETQAVINKNVLVIGLIDVLGFLLIGGVIVIPTVADVDIVWITGLSFLLILGLIFVIVALIYYSRRGLQPMCPRICPRTGVLINVPQPMALMSNKARDANSNSYALNSNYNNNNNVKARKVGTKRSIHDF